MGNIETRYKNVVDIKCDKKTGKFKFGRCPHCKSVITFRNELLTNCIVCSFPVKWEK